MDRQAINRQAINRQALFEKFLDSLQTVPQPPDYLAAEPESTAPFDPYQMVAEWIALRHEVKQQGKLLQSSQTMLQQALTALETEQEQLRIQQAASSQQGAALADQKTLWRELLAILDALDQACSHWQTQIDNLAAVSSSPPSPPQSGLQQFWQRWKGSSSKPAPAQADPAATALLRDLCVSNQQGIDLVRRSLLDILKQHQVLPILAQGQAFNPQTMYAVGRQARQSAAETIPENISDNTVVQEVVRGYFWGDQVLREAQVIVAVNQE